MGVLSDPKPPLVDDGGLYDPILTEYGEDSQFYVYSQFDEFAL